MIKIRTMPGPCLPITFRVPHRRWSERCCRRTTSRRRISSCRTRRRSRASSRHPRKDTCIGQMLIRRSHFRAPGAAPTATPDDRSCFGVLISCGRAGRLRPSRRPGRARRFRTRAGGPDAPAWSIRKKPPVQFTAMASSIVPKTAVRRLVQAHSSDPALRSPGRTGPTPTSDLTRSARPSRDVSCPPRSPRELVSCKTFSWPRRRLRPCQPSDSAPIRTNAMVTGRPLRLRQAWRVPFWITMSPDASGVHRPSSSSRTISPCSTMP